MKKILLISALLLGALVFTVPVKQAYAGMGWGMGMHGAKFEALGKLFNMTPEELGTQLQQGKTLKDIAGEKNISDEQLVNAMIDAKKQRVDQLVSDGTITQAQADEWLNLMRQMVNFKVKNNFFWHKGLKNNNANQNTQSSTSMMGTRYAVSYL